MLISKFIDGIESRLL